MGKWVVWDPVRTTQIPGKWPTSSIDTPERTGKTFSVIVVDLVPEAPGHRLQSDLSLPLSSFELRVMTLKVTRKE